MWPLADSKLWVETIERLHADCCARRLLENRVMANAISNVGGGPFISKNVSEMGAA